MHEEVDAGIAPQEDLLGLVGSQTAEGAEHVAAAQEQAVDLR